MKLGRAALGWSWRRLVSWLKLLLRSLKWLLLLPLVLLWRGLPRLEPRMRVLLLRRMLRSLWRIRFRTGVMLLLIVITTLTGVMMAEFSRNGDAIYEEFYGETNLADLVVSTGEQHQPAANFSAACVAFGAADACETRLALDGQFLRDDGEWIAATLYGHAGSPAISSLWFSEGRAASGAGEAVIDRHVQEELGVGLGDTVTVSLAGKMQNYTVVGVANSPHHLFYVASSRTLIPQEGAYAVLYLPVAALAEDAGLEPESRNMLLLDLPGTPAYDLQDTNEDEGVALRELKWELASALRDEGVEGALVGDRGSIHSVELLRQDLEGSRKSIPMTIFLLGAVSALVLAISMERLIRTQYREIAVMRALGFSAVEVRNHYLLVPLLLGLTGVTLGVALGAWFSVGMTSFYFDQWGIPLVRVAHYPDLWLAVAAGVMAIVMLFSLRPALHASRLTPLEVMGQREIKRTQAWAQRLTAWMPVTMGLGVRSTFRKPRRLLLTVAALGLALVILGGWLLTMSSMTGFMRDSLTEVEQWDAQAIFMPQQEQQMRSWAANHSGLEAEWVSVLPGSPAGDDRTFMVWGVGQFGDGGMHGFRLTEGELPQAGAQPVEVLVDQGVAEFLEWEPGEVVIVEIAGTAVEVRVTGITLELTRTLWLHRDDLVAITGWEMVNLVMLRNVDDEALAELEQQALVTRHDDLVAAFDSSMEKYQAIIYTFLVIGAAIAIAVLVNTLIINLTERDAELATLRVLGASKWRLSGVLLVEHAIIGLAGGVIGVAVAIAASKWMVAVFTTWLFHFPLFIDWMVALYLFLFILIAALATTLIGTWRIRRMDLVKSIQEFSQ